MRTVADVPMRDTVPINGVMTGPRSVRWLPHAPATLLWVEALDKGDLRNAVPHRDRIVTLAAPFAGDPSEVGENRISLRRRELDGKGVDSPDRERSRIAHDTDLGAERELERAAKALGPPPAG